jgi:hypothetical protein
MPESPTSSTSISPGRLSECGVVAGQHGDFLAACLALQVVRVTSGMKTVPTGVNQPAVKLSALAALSQRVGGGNGTPIVLMGGLSQL